ncbi:MAG: type secretion protein family [Nevskia sp.]|jgi:type VI secretion system protein ImpJ|nr:type secretion protein family [Nevskia sp.]
MSWENKVIWSEGMFLQQQHFQQHERYIEKLVEARSRPIAPYRWGFSSVALDEAALAIGKFALLSAQGVLPDGTPFDFPGTHAAPLPLDIPADARNQQVMLALPLRRVGTREAEYDGSDEDSLARYRIEEHDVADTAGDGSAPIQVGQIRLRFMLARERTDAYSCLGVARLIERRADNQLVLDQRHIAPTLQLRAASELLKYAREVYGLLHQRGEELAIQLGQPGPGGVAEIADFLLLQTINRYEPEFAHYQQAALHHPEALYIAFLRLAGDLCIFSRENRRAPDYAEYRHDDLEGTFTPLVADLRRSLSMALHRSVVPIELQDKKYGVRVAVINDRELLKSATFVLAVKAQMMPDTLRARFAGQVKMGPVERIRDLVNLQLPGIPLHPMAVAPRQLPYHAGFTYFELERGGELWGQLERSGGLAMHIAGDFPGLELEFWGLKGAA